MQYGNLMTQGFQDLRVQRFRGLGAYSLKGIKF